MLMSKYFSCSVPIGDFNVNPLEYTLGLAGTKVGEDNYEERTFIIYVGLSLEEHMSC